MAVADEEHTRVFFLQQFPYQSLLKETFFGRYVSTVTEGGVHLLSLISSNNK
jgi:hypothetical protein